MLVPYGVLFISVLAFPHPGSSSKVLDFRLPREQCQDGVFTDASNGTENIFGHLKYAQTIPSQCNSGLGTIGPGLISSTKNATDFIKQMNGKQSLGLELWVKPKFEDLGSGAQELIFCIGNAVGQGEEANTLSHNFAENSNFGVKLIAHVDTGKVTISVSSAVSGGSYYVSLTTSSDMLINGESTHLFFSLDIETSNPNSPIKISMYVNGVLGKSRNFFPDIFEPYLWWDTWDDSFRLELFGEHNSSFSGEVLHLAIYDHTLSTEQILGTFAAKVPNSIPLALNATIVLHRQDNGIPNMECAWVEVPMVDQDEDAAYPNYVAADFFTRPMLVYVKQFPKKTAIYNYFDGTEITSENPEVPPVFEDPSTGTAYTAGQAALLPPRTMPTKSYRVRVRPAKDQFSLQPTSGDDDNNSGLILFDFLTFNGVDGETGEQSLFDGTLTLTVLPVNDPPSLNTLHVFVTAGEEVLINLKRSVTDVDSDVSGAKQLGEISITKFPAHGALTVVENSTSVIYNFMDWGSVTPDTMNMSTGEIAQDSFEYVLVNTHEGFNVQGNITITITTPVKATVNSSSSQTNKNGEEVAVAFQGVSMKITFGGADHRGYEVFLVILELPKNTSLQSPSTTMPLLSAGSMLPLENSSVSLLYTSNARGFSSPATNWDGSDLDSGEKHDVLRVQMVSLGENNNQSTALYSVPITLEVKVTNVNERTLFVSQEKSRPNIYAYSSLSTHEDPKFPTLWRPFESIQFSVRGNDDNLDVLKVHASCNSESARLTLPFGTAGLEPIGSEACAIGQDLECTELTNPKGAREVVFVGTLSKIMEIIPNIFYRVTDANFDETCSLSIYDGAGGNCVPLSSLTGRRDGSHTKDQSGETSSYAFPSAFYNSGGRVEEEVVDVPDGEVWCFKTKLKTDINVLDYSYVAAANETKQGPLTLPWSVWLMVCCGSIIISCICVFRCYASCYNILCNILRPLHVALLIYKSPSVVVVKKADAADNKLSNDSDDSDDSDDSQTDLIPPGQEEHLPDDKNDERVNSDEEADQSASNLSAADSITKLVGGNSPRSLGGSDAKCLEMQFINC